MASYQIKDTLSIFILTCKILNGVVPLYDFKTPTEWCEFTCYMFVLYLFTKSTELYS